MSHNCHILYIPLSTLAVKQVTTSNPEIFLLDLFLYSAKTCCRLQSAPIFKVYIVFSPIKYPDVLKKHIR